MRFALVALFHLFLLTACGQNGRRLTPNRIHEERFIKLNGIEQWVTIKGDSIKPVVLFLHGGPGNPLSPFADAIYGEWEKDFILVQWDQRGAGRTYGRNAPEELTPEYIRSNPLTIEQMTTDGIELVQYLLRYLSKEKIILFGSSWGSVLGVKMATRRPELFYAYIGDSQVVNPYTAELSAYNKVYEMARNDKDQNSIDVLNAIGKPPYEKAKNTGQLNRIIQKYQQKKSIPPPASWFQVPPEYANERDSQNRFDADDYSFVNYAGDKSLGILSMSAGINFLNDNLDFKIPVYLIQGEKDIQTPPEITTEYYNKLKAPAKKMIILPNTGHGFNQSVIDAQYRV